MKLKIGFKGGGEVLVHPADAIKFVQGVCETAMTANDWYAEPLCVIAVKEIAYIVPVEG